MSKPIIMLCTTKINSREKCKTYLSHQRKNICPKCIQRFFSFIDSFIPKSILDSTNVSKDVISLNIKNN